jgi:arylsulfatase A-like enzyme
VTFADAEVGRILDVVDREGLLDDTVVILTSDHGEVLYEHDHYFGHDIMLYEPSLSVPLIIRAPGIFPEGEICAAPARLIDLAPTILDATGLPAETLGATDGVSLLPGVWREGKSAERRWGKKQLAGATKSARLADTLFAEVFPPKEGWKVEPRHAIRTPGWKLLFEDGVDARQVFNLAADPLERHDLSAALPDTLARLLAAWETWRVGKESTFHVEMPTLDAETEENLRALGYIN